MVAILELDAGGAPSTARIAGEVLKLDGEQRSDAPVSILGSSSNFKLLLFSSSSYTTTAGIFWCYKLERNCHF